MKYRTPCPYCASASDNRLLNAGTYDLSRIEVQIIEESRVLRIRAYHNNDTNMVNENQEYILIKYCPICGRDLAVKEDNIYNERLTNNND